MSPEDTQPPAASELRNKEETELPIGEVREPESRGVAMWRCRDCGEMGHLEEELPPSCPGCDAPREDLYYWEED
ncbi:DUF7130 family rubredoxin-like protein [Natronolimnohabitans innermongolicus]|uniref:DUF7130 domain-containing protein n=1 Tax=Natronolimnohabitans innermongolicus JCM 12255 TaxID=1227499 RepID=L9XGB8_9EURY|nr:hypothetical protein [Natronolimnohabitans innermongolicus]ELY60779.1 hypothetical protein C493_03717 [Natronolimnohabitans innermongolicus JCM 12255]